MLIIFSDDTVPIGSVSPIGLQVNTGSAAEVDSAENAGSKDSTGTN